MRCVGSYSSKEFITSSVMNFKVLLIRRGVLRFIGRVRVLLGLLFSREGALGWNTEADFRVHL